LKKNPKRPKIREFPIKRLIGTFLTMSLIEEGTTKKVMQFKMPLKSKIAFKNFGELITS
jgi:hypothetical protein